MEYASKGVGAAGLTTGIIGAAGTGLGLLANAFGRNADPGDRPVTRYEMELHDKIAEKNSEIVLLKAEQYSDNKANVLQAEIGQQLAWNATAMAQLHQLMGMTKLMIPNDEVIPASSGSGS